MLDTRDAHSYIQERDEALEEDERLGEMDELEHKIPALERELERAPSRRGEAPAAPRQRAGIGRATPVFGAVPPRNICFCEGVSSDPRDQKNCATPFRKRLLNPLSSGARPGLSAAPPRQCKALRRAVSSHAAPRTGAATVGFSRSLPLPPTSAAALVATTIRVAP